MYLDDLPVEIILKIIKIIGNNSRECMTNLMNLYRSCKYFYRIFNENNCWSVLRFYYVDWNVVTRLGGEYIHCYNYGKKSDLDGIIIHKLKHLTVHSGYGFRRYCENMEVNCEIIKHTTCLEGLAISGNMKFIDGIEFDYFMNLKNLSVNGNSFNPNWIISLPFLEILSICNNTNITNWTIERLPNIKKLTLKGCTRINDLSSLNKLEYLDISKNKTITSFRGLSSLKTLILRSNNVIDDDDVRGLTNLQHLNLNENKKITDNGISELWNLVRLNLCHNTIITDEAIRAIPNLRYLNLKLNSMISDYGICELTMLRTLNLTGNRRITDWGIRRLSNLRRLIIKFNKTITHNGTSYLPQCVMSRNGY